MFHIKKREFLKLVHNILHQFNNPLNAILNDKVGFSSRPVNFVDSS